MKEMTLKQIQEELGYEVKIVAEPEQSKVWKPSNYEGYFLVNTDGKVEYLDWDGDSMDNWAWLIGNCFRTKEEAEFYREQLIVTTELQRFADEHNEEIDWENNLNIKYHLFYFHQQRSVCVSQVSDWQMGIIYFSSKEIAEKAIESIGADRIKKYYLGVRE